MLGKAETAGMKVNRQCLQSRCYRPDPHGPSQEPNKGFWRFRGRHVQGIPADSRMHSSVWGRRESTANEYSPKDLLDRDLGQIVELRVP